MSPKQILIILKRRAWAIVLTLLATIAGAGLVVLLVPPRFDAQATATVDPAQSDPVTGASLGVGAARYTQGNMVALVKSQKVAVEVVKRLNLTSSPVLVARYRSSDAVGRVDATDWIAAELLRNVDARFTEGTNVLTITYKWSDGILAAQLANTFLSAFVDAAIEMKVAGAQQTAQWFEPQTQKLRVEVEEMREKVSQFQRTAKLAPVTNGDSEVTMLNQITGDLSTARGEALKIESMLAETRRPKTTETAAQPFDSQLLQALRSNLASNVSELSKIQSELGSRNPRVTALEATQKSLNTQIVAEIANIRANLESRLMSLNGQIASLDKARTDQVERLIEIQNQRDKMAQLSRDLDVKQERLIIAARTAAAAQLQGQLSFSNIAVIDKATAPVAPSFPKSLVIMPLAVLAGLGLGVILALILESLDRRIRTLADLDFATLAPSLGQLLASPRGRLVLPGQMLAFAGLRRSPG